MTATSVENMITPGHYLIINKNETYLIHQISNKAILKLGRDVIDLKMAIGQSYSSTYKLEPVTDKKRHYTLVVCNDNQARNQWATNGCGTDNKLITDDSSSQLLSTDEIIALKESGETGQNIVERLLKNSKTFQLKTEYAQEKYLKKKARKYCDYITIFKPTIRLITDVLYKQQTIPKTIALRFDTLAQILCRINLDPGGKYLLYENGSQGLLQAALLNQLHDNGSLVHIFSSTSEQNPLKAVKAMNFSESKIKQMLTVSLDEILNTKSEYDIPEEKVEEVVFNCSDDKKRKSDEAYTQLKKKHRPITSTDGLNFIQSNKFDGLIVVCREEPNEFVKILLPYLSLSRPFVVYSAYKEILVTMYAEFKMRRDLVFLRLTDNFLRHHQVLPNRTHPDVTMDDGSGYLFSGLFVTDSEENYICGFSKKQIQDTLLYAKKYPTKGIALNYACLKEQNIGNDRCLTEQYKLIECLRKECFLTNEQGNEITKGTNIPKDQILKNQEIKKRYQESIVKGNEELDNAVKYYEETMLEHLQSIDNLMKKRIYVDDINIALTNLKIELTAAIRRQMLNINIDQNLNLLY
ncbi:Hypothetical protein CINCED_3A021695 [Cinara cedri]|uniref:tRNA (adenine(58)-N(1))-methyltransferase non-catalytic subunit TRM6 n=1 Tax=Cinara cedri TaxID=506608 RepID=A0A5E4NHS3_9HEMI|nr:Hypothetical protein CINCED_3A021695 [Cinara cedri]